MSFELEKIREQFPILQQKVYNKPLVYFDNGATTQKPVRVINKINEIHEKLNSSIHRGIHHLSGAMTNSYEDARETIAHFIHANKKEELIFTSGTTGAVNLLAFSFGEAFIKEDDEVIVTEMEHHANIVPWQMLCERKGAKLKVLPIDDNGELILEQLKQMLSPRVKILALTHISNVLGTVNPIKDIIAMAHEADVPVFVDAAQSVQHVHIDVQNLDCDFMAFSGHKCYGPTGVGMLYGKEKWLEKMPPYQGGGDMVDVVDFEKTTYNVIPFKFEAGTTNYVGAIGFGEAIRFIEEVGVDNIAAHESGLLKYATEKINEIGGITIYGNAPNKSAILSFNFDNIHMMDVGMVLDKLGIAVRTGTHCAQPIMKHYGTTGMVRASLALYNSMDEIDYFCQSLQKVKTMFG